MLKSDDRNWIGKSLCQVVHHHFSVNSYGHYEHVYTHLWGNNSSSYSDNFFCKKDTSL